MNELSYSIGLLQFISFVTWLCVMVAGIKSWWDQGREHLCTICNAYKAEFLAIIIILFRLTLCNRLLSLLYGFYVVIVHVGYASDITNLYHAYHLETSDGSTAYFRWRWRGGRGWRAVMEALILCIDLLFFLIFFYIKQLCTRLVNLTNSTW